MANYGQHINTRKTSQSEQASPKQKKNSAGGYTFVVDEWDKLDRFLILGTEGSTYYASEKKLTVDNATSILALIEKDGLRVVNRCVEVSVQGRAPKNDQAIFVLAMCSASKEEVVRKAVYEAIPKVCRIGTHLFHFTRDMESFRGWSRGLRTAVANWYKNRSVESLAMQVVKYQQRDGWSNRDLLRLSHPSGASPEQNAVFAWVVSQAEKDSEKRVKARKKVVESNLPDFIKAFEEAQLAVTPEHVIDLINEHNLPREALQTQHLNNPKVWEALLPNMGITALIRNLGKMTSIGLIAPGSEASKLAVSKLTDTELLKRGRVHPMGVLMALKTYSNNQGVKGSLTWESVSQVVDALDDAFYASFDFVEPTGKNIVLALDVSGSMGFNYGGTDTVGGVPNLTAREASAAMAMVTARTEKNYTIVAFTGGRGYENQASNNISVLNISPKQRLDDVVKSVSNLPFGATDCALPMIWAQDKNVKADAFFVYTDNETWAGKIQPHQALREYRNASGIAAKEVIVGMTATDFTIADPDDAGMMDVVGFDASAPQIMADFIRD